MIAIKNDGDTVRYVGGVAIPPGETRPVDPNLVPGLAEPEKPAEKPPEPDFFETLLAGNVASIEKTVPDLSDDGLNRLGERESAKPAPRKGVLAAIDKERLDRANFAEQLAQAGDDELAGLAEQHAGRQGFLDMIEARLESGKGVDDGGEQ